MSFIMSRRGIAVIVVLFIAMVLATVALQQRQAPPVQTYTFATGSDTGMYHAFGTAVVELGLDDAALRQTDGSAENLDLLQSGEVEFAFVQNDLAQYSALGIRQRERFDELNYVMPVFPEYVQVIVPEESELRVFGDLRGQQVCVGNSGSGTYYNAIDVLEEAGLREGVDFFPVAQASFECLERLEEGGIAAVFLTSNRLVAEDEDNYRQLFFSETLASALDDRFEYFRVIRPDTGLQPAPPQLAVDAYLATRSDVDEAIVAEVTSELISRWPEMQAALPGLPEILVPDVRETIPYHPGSDGELEEAGLKPVNWLFAQLLALGVLVFILCVWVENRKFAYNRLGENPYSKGWRKQLMRAVGWWSRYFIGAAMIGIFIIMAVYGLRLIEDRYALANGTVSPFAQMDWYDSFIWLFTYIGNGFTADDVYPVSFEGKVVVGVLAVIGFALPITTILYLVNVSARNAERNQEGLGTSNFHKHVVICGWNERTKGIVSTLTGVNVPSKKKVVIVAQPQERLPLDMFHFNDRRVGFCRGSASDRKILERAGVAHAESVIIMADFAGSQSKNKGSILAAMNAKAINPNAHLCAELEYIDNVDLLQSAGCKTLIYNQLVACRAATIAALSMDLVDYVLDCATYHDSSHDELYSEPGANVIRKLREYDRALTEPTVADLRLVMARNGVNVVGVVDNTYREAGVDPAFSGGEDRTLVDLEYRKRPLEQDATVIFAAQKHDQILRNNFRRRTPDPVSAPEFKLALPEKLSIAVCSGPATLATLEEELRALLGDGLQFTGIDLSVSRPRTLEAIRDLVPEGIEKCVILNTQHERSDIDSMDQVNEADTDVMLLSALFERLREERGESWEIIGEVSNFENRDLLRTAGADHILPVSLFIERFLTKEVYDRNHVIDFLLAGMRLSDGVHLHRHVVTPGDGFCGERYDELLATQIEGVRILGWRPENALQELRNVDGDFGYHYRMVYDRHRIKNQVAAEGDLIIMMVRRRPSYPNGSLDES